jgi:hypothetical protein
MESAVGIYTYMLQIGRSRVRYPMRPPRPVTGKLYFYFFLHSILLAYLDDGCIVIHADSQRFRGTGLYIYLAHIFLESLQDMT